MNETQLQLLLDAAKKIGVNPTSLKPINPFKMKGAMAESMRVAVAELDPVQSAAWASEAGAGESLAAAAYKAGVTGISLAVHEELLSKDPDYIEQQTHAASAEEQRLLDEMEAGRKALAARREAATKMFSRNDRIVTGGTVADQLRGQG